MLQTGNNLSHYRWLPISSMSSARFTVDMTIGCEVGGTGDGHACVLLVLLETRHSIYGRRARWESSILPGAPLRRGDLLTTHFFFMTSLLTMTLKLPGTDHRTLQVHVCRDFVRQKYGIPIFDLDFTSRIPPLQFIWCLKYLLISISTRSSRTPRQCSVSLN